MSQAGQIHIVAPRICPKRLNLRLSDLRRTPAGFTSMKKLLGLGLIMWGSAANAQNAPAPATPTQDQGEARQFGILVGGTATQYDLCVKKGFIAKMVKVLTKTRGLFS